MKLIVTRMSVYALLLLASTSFVHAAVIYDESSSGDLSSNNLSPTVLNTAIGSNIVRGATTFAPLDRDFFTITVAPGQQLVAILLETFNTTEDQAFFAVESGAQISSTTNPATFLGATLFGAAPGAQVGDNILDELGAASLGGSGFVGALGAGTYTFWLQETSADIDAYSLDIRVVPIPSAFLLLISALGLLGFKSKQTAPTRI